MKRANANLAKQDLPPLPDKLAPHSMRREVPTAAERRRLHSHQEADIGGRDGNASIDDAEEHGA